jgi:NADH-quinone oxidoreductase subunit I
MGKDRVIQYPEEKREDLPIEKGGMQLNTYRGVHRLNKDEEGRVKCVACFMCSTACPARCIHIEAEESPWPDREKYPAKFDIDELRCIYCGMCEEACPVDAIELTHVYDIVGLTRQEMIFDKSKLLKIYDQTVAAFRPRQAPSVPAPSELQSPRPTDLTIVDVFAIESPHSRLLGDGGDSAR